VQERLVHKCLRVSFSNLNAYVPTLQKPSPLTEQVNSQPLNSHPISYIVRILALLSSSFRDCLSHLESEFNKQLLAEASLCYSCD
jgi:hypothetical protein